MGTLPLYDADLLLSAYRRLTEVRVILQQKTISHADIIMARATVETALSNIQELENRFRQGVIQHATPTTPPSH